MSLPAGLALLYASTQDMPLDEFLAGGGNAAEATASPLLLFAEGIQLVLAFGVVVVLAYFFTKWIAGVRYRRGAGSNLQLLESIMLNQQTYLQLVRVGKRYFVLGLTKNSVTHISEVDKGDISESAFHSEKVDSGVPMVNFGKYLQKIVRKQSSKDDHSNQ